MRCDTLSAVIVGLDPTTHSVTFPLAPNAIVLQSAR